MNKNKNVIRVALVVVFLALVAFGGWTARGWWMEKERDNVVSTASDISKQIDAGNVAEAYSRASTDYKASFDQEEFAETISTVAAEDVNVGLINEVYEGYEGYKVEYTLENAEQESQGALILIMVKESGDWVFRDLLLS